MNITVGEIIKATGGELLSGPEDVTVSRIATDSRLVTDGTLYVPVIGQRADGHEFIASACEHGAVAAFTSEGIIPVPGDTGHFPALIGVPDTVRALQALGSYYRSTYARCIFVGVTGSVGKTTTREMTLAALSPSFKTYSTKGNANSQVGVPITVCDTPPDTQIGVIELGISEFGEMERIAAVARPDIVIITRISECHIAQLISKENILREKLKSAEYIRDGAALILNRDDELMGSLTEEKIISMGINLAQGFKIRFFGLGDGAFYGARDIRHPSDGAEYDFYAGNDFKAHISLKVPGMHMIYDSLGALAAACECGADIDGAVRNLSEFNSVGGRGEIRESNGIKVINDAYNASPLSMVEGLKVLSGMKALPGSRRIAVIADMLELGSEEERFHRDIGKTLLTEFGNIDVIYFYGDLMKYAYEEVLSARDESGPVPGYFTAADELLSALKDIAKTGDIVFFKGSNSTGLNKIAASFDEYISCCTLKL